jgi:hypothetical protein
MHTLFSWEDQNKNEEITWGEHKHRWENDIKKDIKEMPY